ncbi:hypothetical protein KEM54_002577, partial [Ascosphaera aggregata]
SHKTAHSQEMEDINSQVRALIAEHRFFQLSANWCPDCVYANALWDRLGVKDKIHIYDIGDMPKPEQERWRGAFLELIGSRNLPTIVIDGKFWGTESRLHELENKGDNALENELKLVGLL